MFSREIATGVHQKRSNVTSTGTSYSYLKTLSTLNKVITEITVGFVSMTHNKIQKLGFQSEVPHLKENTSSIIGITSVSHQ